MTTITEIDYAGLFEALRNYQKGDNRFKDIDYDASGINSIIKFLAANSSAAALNNYFSMNESFVGTSEILANVQALVTAQSGYVPFGKKSSSCICDIVVTPSELASAPSTLQLPTTTTAAGIGDGQTLVFTPKTVYQTSLVNGVYTFNNVIMLEGQKVTNTFTQNGSGIVEYEIPNKNIDISTLVVNVRTSLNDASTTQYNRFTSAFQLGKEEPLFYLSMNRNGKYKIEFGDGVFSKALENGNIIYVTSIVSNGLEGDGVGSLIATSEVNGYGDVKIDVTRGSFGGAEAESIETIQFKAKTAQGMEGAALTMNEYELKLSELLPAYRVKAWGGEDAIPQRPGYVMFTTYPVLNDVEQIEVKNELNKVSVGSILTNYAPFKTYGVTVNVFYVSDGSEVSNKTIEKSIASIVKQYATNTVDFGSSFAPRVLENQLEGIENISRIYVSYTASSPTEISNDGFSFNYHREIGVMTFEATFEGDDSFDTIKDIGSGFYKYKNDEQGEQIVVNINYETGLLSITGLDTSIITCTSNKASPAGDDYFLEVEPYEFLEIELGEVSTL